MSSSNEYMRVYMLNRYKERMAWAISQLGGQCVTCGTREGLELDHIDPATKSFTIGSMWSCSWGKFVAEVAKCQLLCEAHHISKTVKEARAGVSHGTVWMYRLGCRCEECVLARKASNKHYRRVAQGRATDF